MLVHDGFLLAEESAYALPSQLCPVLKTTTTSQLQPVIFDQD